MESDVKTRFFDRYVDRDIRNDWFSHHVDVLTLSQIMKIETEIIQKDRIKAIKQNIKDSQKGRSKMVKDEQRQRKKLDTISAWVY